MDELLKITALRDQNQGRGLRFLSTVASLNNLAGTLMTPCTGIVVFASDVASTVFVVYLAARQREAMESHDERNNSDRHSERP